MSPVLIEREAAAIIHGVLVREFGHIFRSEHLRSIANVIAGKLTTRAVEAPAADPDRGRTFVAEGRSLYDELTGKCAPPFEKITGPTVPARGGNAGAKGKGD